ncbi:MAG: CBS domain-containing protein [Candidatus Dormibacteraeota bacterium]|uniref:CBS domain-containing protein n=1 Tax=Candidatus Amunia macphersoniae TaxID=3127014 RepID=A0A934NFN3_9BACT|nr:CBS domain-containing protein [Candidatus Dormibacteraeota bacterium]
MSSIPVAASLDPDRLAPDAANPVVADVMRDEVVFCLPSTPVDAIAKLMADNELVEIPVLLDRRPVGYVRQGDILDRLVVGDVAIAGSDVAMRPPTTVVQARDILHTPPLLADERQQVREVASLMAQQGRQLALVMHEDDTPVGMLTARELADHLLAHPEIAGA